jgi:hypothetical protein
MLSELSTNIDSGDALGEKSANVKVFSTNNNKLQQNIVKSLKDVDMKMNDIKNKSSQNLKSAYGVLESLSIVPTGLYYLICMAASIAFGVLVLWFYQRYLWPVLFRPIVAILRFFFSIIDFITSIGKGSGGKTTSPPVTQPSQSGGDVGNVGSVGGIEALPPASRTGLLSGTIAPATISPSASCNALCVQNQTESGNKMGPVAAQVRNSTVTTNPLMNATRVFTSHAYDLIGMFLAVVAVLLIYLGIMYLSSFVIEIFPSFMYAGFFGLPMIICGFMFIVGFGKSINTVEDCACQKYSGPFSNLVSWLYKKISSLSTKSNDYTTVQLMNSCVYIPKGSAFNVTKPGETPIYAWVTLAIMALSGLLLFIMWIMVKIWMFKISVYFSQL